MNHEVFLKAMTQIDDELIVSASDMMQKPKKKNPFLIFSIAACLTLICGIALFSRFSATVEISIYDSILSNQTIRVDLPAPAESDIRVSTPELISIPIQINADRIVHMSTKDGTIEVYSPDYSELLYTGQSYQSKELVYIQWKIEQPNIGKTYTLIINNNIDISLFYDETQKCWKIQKQKSQVLNYEKINSNSFSGSLIIFFHRLF